MRPPASVPSARPPAPGPHAGSAASMPSGDRAGRDRLPSLTGLRFWAALLVVLYHLSRQAGELPGLSEAVRYGRSGVTFFFVLSGFVLAWTYDGRRVPAPLFLWRRFARIWPLLAATTALSVGAWLALGRDVSAKAVTASLLLVHAWTPDPVILRGGNPAAWSLSDEAWFYLLFPLLMALPAVRSARGRRWIAGGVCVAVVPVWLTGALIHDAGTRAWALDYLPLTRTAQFLLGVVTGLAVARGRRPPVGPWAAVALVAGWHLALVPWSRAVPDALWYSPYTASQLLAAPLFALLVATVARADLDGRPTGLGGRWATRLGQWSYAWYLIHEIVIRLWLGYAGAPAGPSGTAVVWSLVLLVSLALAAGAYHAVEHPLERWLRARGPAARGPGARGPGTGPAAEPSVPPRR
ncbi:acyltransferase family protein [Streptomyces lavendofoliae]|uniref:Acyltransferase n=1 Tax=Streptomyces lavendofoliae TaxID=67314 RepID=A0A918M5L3_9ACTN|nr:acyltransferase [Streptomyces lavendofoliae]GGU43724.1 acyltransferase [Streptomyces lavendofoliae]